MTKGEWNGLRAGDVVFVHDSWSTPAAAVRGTVGSVDLHGRQGNGVGIHLDTGEVVWPSRLSAHRSAVEAAAGCWRCEDVAAQSA